MRAMAACSALLLLVACAPGGQTSGPGVASTPRDIDVNPNDATFNLVVRREANVVSADLAAPADSLWPKLVAAFAELKLPVTSADPGTHLVLSSSGKRTTSVDGQRVARFFECPATGYGNSAQGQDTYITVQARLFGSGTGKTELRIETQAYVVLNGTNVQCRSTARLEQRIAEVVAKRAGLVS